MGEVARIFPCPVRFPWCTHSPCRNVTVKAWIRSALIVLLVSRLLTPPAVASIAARVQAATNARKQAEQKQVEKVTVARGLPTRRGKGVLNVADWLNVNDAKNPQADTSSSRRMSSRPAAVEPQNRRKNCSPRNRGRNRRTTVPSRRIWPAAPTRDPSWRRTKRTWTQVLNRPPTTTSRPNPTRNSVRKCSGCATRCGRA